MQNEADEVIVNYFVLCDNVISEAGTGKQSIIGAYSALFAGQFPANINVAVAFGFRVQSPREREIKLRLTGPSGETIFETPALPFDWKSARTNLQNSSFATLQIGLNLQAVPIQRAGVYTAAMYSDGELLVTYPISVQVAPPGGPRPQIS